MLLRPPKGLTVVFQESADTQPVMLAFSFPLAFSPLLKRLH